MRLLERGSELDTLAGALPDGASSGGRLIVVEGAAGNGKSSLLSAVGERALGRGIRVLAARGGELERAFPFGTIRRLFEKTLADADAADRERLLVGAAAPAGSVVARSPSDAPTAPGFPVLHAIYWLLSNLAAAAPLLVAVDDLHWVDESSLLALSYVGRRVADIPVSLAVALRPHEPGAPAELIDELTTEPDALKISLPPLGPRSVAELVRDVIPEADDALCAACHKATGGNPFYLRELLGTIAGDGAAALRPEAVREAAVPEIGERVLRRIARLDPKAQPLAQAMAVLGDGGRLSDAASLAVMPDDEAADVTRAMARIDILAGEDPFEFAHPLVRRSVYDSLTVTERDATQLAAGQLLRERGATSEVVAAHYALVRPAGSADVAETLDAAAGEAMARGAPRAAIEALRRALAEDAPRPPRGDLLHRLGQVLAMEQDPSAAESLTQALELAPVPAQRSHIAIDLSALYAFSGRWKDAVQVVTDGIAELGTADAELSLQMEAIRAVILMHDAELAGTFEADSERLRALADEAPWGARALAALLADKAAIRGDPRDEVLELADLALRDWQLIRPPDAGGWATAQVVGALAMCEADERAREVVDRLRDAARRYGSFWSVLLAHVFDAWLAIRNGDLAVGEAAAAPVLDAALRNNVSMDMVSSVYFLADAMVERTELEHIAGFLETFELDPSFMHTASGGMMHYSRGRIRAARGEQRAAIGDLRAAGEIFTKLGFGPAHNAWRSQLALALPAQDREEARALAAEEVELASTSGVARPRGIALRAAGTLANGDGGIEMLRESVELLTRSPARLEHARSLAELGAMLRRLNHRVEAREALAEGRDLANRCGAHRTVARATEELLAAGARPRRIERRGVDALTPSERRVAQLVAEGRSNAEVAQELFVSLKTVETHLTRAYGKLGLAGAGARERVADALRERR